MGISRRGVISLIGAGLGSVGIAGATKMNNQTSTPTGDQNQQGDGDGETNDDKNEQGNNENENDEQNEQEDGDGETNDSSESDSESEKDEKSFTQSDVKLAPADAKQAATSTVSGSVSSVSLENHDGSPVYQVIVTPNSGPATQVTVNANTGTVVKTESASED